MGKYVVRYGVDGGAPAKWGVLRDNRVSEIEGDFSSLKSLLTNGAGAIESAGSRSGDIDVNDLELLSPLTPPARLHCLGLNYAMHRTETGQTAQKPSEMLVFAKDITSLASATDDIILPDSVALLDYEVELGIVFGEPINEPVDLNDKTFGDYVAGLVICNDISARDDQFGGPFLQWYQAKSYRTFCPAGPYLWMPDPDEHQLIYELEVMTKVNGNVMQKASTGDFIFRPPEAISRLSKVVNIDVGDCLLTGTPGGVSLQIGPETQALLKDELFSDATRRAAFIRDQKERSRYLRKGDLVELSIKGPSGKVDLGTQRNRIA